MIHTMLVRLADFSLPIVLDTGQSLLRSDVDQSSLLALYWNTMIRGCHPDYPGYCLTFYYYPLNPTKERDLLALCYQFATRWGFALSVVVFMLISAALMPIIVRQIRDDIIFSLMSPLEGYRLFKKKKK